MSSADGSVIEFNRRGVAYLGVARGAVTLREAFCLLHARDIPRVRAVWEKGLRTGTAFEVETRIRRADGVFRWNSVRAAPVRGADARVSAWAGTATDIEDGRRLHEGLRLAERQAAEALTVLESLQATAPVGFILVDRDFRFVRVNERAAAITGHAAADHIGRTLAEMVPALWPQAEPALRRVLATREIVADVELSGEGAREPGMVHDCLVTFYPVSIAGAVTGVGVVIVDVTERKRAEVAQAALVRASILAIAAVVEARDPYTAGHQGRVAELAAAIAAELGQDAHETEGIRLAASIHDIGKIAVPSEILNKPGPLSAPEVELIKEHAQAGHDIVAGIDFPWPIAEMILQHHERLDGSGYPQGLRGDGILLGARIIAVADVVDAMEAHRPYRPARGPEAAMATLIDGRGALFDAGVVDAYRRVAGR